MGVKAELDGVEDDVDKGDWTLDDSPRDGVRRVA